MDIICSRSDGLLLFLLFRGFGEKALYSLACLLPSKAFAFEICSYYGQRNKNRGVYDERMIPLLRCYDGERGKGNGENGLGWNCAVQHYHGGKSKAIALSSSRGHIYARFTSLHTGCSNLNLQSSHMHSLPRCT